MLDLAKLLICDGRPNKEMINFLLEKKVHQIVERAMSVISRPLSKIDVENFILTDNTIIQHEVFLINCYTKDYDEVYSQIKDSIKIYSPLIKFDYEREITVNYGNGTYDCPLPIIDPSSNFLLTFIFPLILKITPEMKKTMLLDQELTKKDGVDIRRIKI